MNEFQKQVVLLFSIPIYVIIIPLEILLSNFKHRKFYSWKETAVNIYLNLLNAGVDLMLRLFIAFALMNFIYQYHLPITWNPVVYWLVLLFGEDLLFWTEHYVDHSVRLFWAVHVTHHSSPEYNLSTGFRSSVFMPVYKYLYFIPLVLLNFKPMDIVFMFSVTQIYGILVHTQSIKKLPRWIEYIFVTPSHHRVHHASNIPYLDRNMGMVFIFWDRMFGTFTEELPGEKPYYGLTTPLKKPFHPVHIVTHEWQAIGKDLRKTTSLRTKLNYLLRPPGWSHDGSTKTSKELQKDWKPGTYTGK
ncbi:MAG: Sterol desaturase [Flavipsychrobacter sp.]|nr:Sterol desaturase [Flavipsychrobacter sp.]